MEKLVSGLGRGNAGLAEGQVSSVVQNDVGGAVLLLVSRNAAYGSGCNFVCADRLPVAREKVPVDGCEAEFAGEAEDDGAAGSVRWPEVADRLAEGVLEDGVAAG